MTKRNPKAGVTLLETLVGLLVMAMVAALLSAGFGSSIRMLNRGEATSELVDQALARRDLRRWLEHALETPVPGDNRPVLSGTATELSFLAIPPDGLFWLGTATAISLGPSVVAKAQGTGANQRDELQVTLALAPEGSSLEFRYWGRSAPDLRPEWHDTWASEQGLPDLIRITFKGEGPLPPLMAIRPAKTWRQSEMSLSSLVPPALPSRP
jgi:type II secretory pathway pseudopilin PulG